MDQAEKDLSTLLQSDNGCQYTDLSDVDSAVMSSRNNVNFLHINIRSFQKNCDNLTMLLTDLQEKGIIIHLIGICETFLSIGSASLANIENYHSVHRYQKDKVGGGTTVLLHDSVKLTEVLNTHFNDCFESTCVKALLNGKQICFAEVYRSPNSNDVLFMNSLSNLLKNFDDKNVINVICSDQNYDLLKCDSHKGTRNFLTKMLDNEFMPYINKPTQITHHGGTLIDNIYVKSKLIKSNISYVITDDMSDHYPCLLSYAVFNKPEVTKPVIVEKRKFTEENIAKIQQALLFHN